METLIRRWDTSRVVPVTGDLGKASLGVAKKWVGEHRGKVDHFFHLAAIYDMTADDDTNQRLNVDGTRHALELATALGVGCLHHVSSVAAAGDFHGRFTRPCSTRASPSLRRTTGPSTRPSSSSGRRRPCRGASTAPRSSSATPSPARSTRSTGPTTSSRRSGGCATLPRAPFVGADLGNTNVVPVDYVANALHHLAHVRAWTGTRSTWSPGPQPVTPNVSTRSRARRRRARPRAALPRRPVRPAPAAAPARSRSPPAPAWRATSPSTGWTSRRGAATRASRRPSTPAAPRRHWPAPASSVTQPGSYATCCGTTGRSTSTLTGRDPGVRDGPLDGK